jgi:hypothetical protein
MPPLPQTWDAQIVSTTKEANKVTLVFDVIRLGTPVSRLTLIADDTAPRPPNAISYSLSVQNL